MTSSETLTGARTMWELVDRRAAASPEHAMLDRGGRARPSPSVRSVTAPSAWQPPCSEWVWPKARSSRGSCRRRIDSVVLSIALARLGAVQNPIIHLYREREVGFALRQTGASLFVIPGTWRGTDFAALAERALEGAEQRPTVLNIEDGLPEADPGVLPPPPPGTSAEDRPDPLDLLHLGLDGRPQRRPAHRPDPHRGWVGPRPRPRHGP